jgi:hypothetical protein
LLPTIWNKISQSCDEVSLWVPPFFLTKPDREARRWVIGRFCDLKGIAPVVRTDMELREAFSELYTAEMASERGSFSRQMSASAASNLLTKIDDSLYAGPVMTQLNAMAKIIIEEVRRVLTTKR